MSTTTRNETTSASDILGTESTTSVVKKPRAKRAAPKKTTKARTTVRKSAETVEENSGLNGKIAGVFTGIRNIFVGMGLSFMGNLPIFLDPVGFLFFNSPKIALGLLHLFMPFILAAAVVWQNQSLLNKVLSFSLEGVVLSVSLYAFGTFAWMLGWLFARSIAGGVSRVFGGFAKTGEQRSGHRQNA